MMCGRGVVGMCCGVDIAEFNVSSSDEQLSVARHSSALIPCHVPDSVPSPPLISYLRDGRPLKLTGTSVLLQ